MSTRARAPDGDLTSYARETFRHGELARDVLRKGRGPAVLILTELPGISPQVLGFADRVVALGCTAVLPDLFGEAGRDPDAGGFVARLAYGLGTALRVCIRREFTALALGKSAPVIDFLRALAAREHARCGGPGVGVVGMCFTGGFALAMATDARVLAPVLSQPSLPLPLGAARRRTIDCSAEDLARVRSRCAADGLTLLGLRFHDDPLVPAERFAFLREQLGDAFVAVELDQASGHPDDTMRRHHSVLTRALVDVPGEPTHAALTQVLALFQQKLLGPRAAARPEPEA